MEHRWGTRHLLDASVRLDGRPHLLTFARLKNASASGAYVETRAAPPMLTRVWVELEWHLCRRDDSNRVAAYVVRTDERGMGLEWCDLAPRAILALIERSQRLTVRQRREKVPAEIRRLPSVAIRPNAAATLPAVYTPLESPPAIARLG
ncbi:MAG: PilZ domain-containing protein [Steroidobacteraceae bacterium]